MVHPAGSNLRPSDSRREKVTTALLAIAQKLAGHNDSKMMARVYTDIADAIYAPYVNSLNAYCDFPPRPGDPHKFVY